ncbi:MAG: hypothetical protein ACRDZO_07735 [Egibacteraceae bacterium]
MLHMEILRSPIAHAGIKSIDTSKAWEIPGVHMVLGPDLYRRRWVHGRLIATRSDPTAATGRHSSAGSPRRCSPPGGRSTRCPESAA